MDEGIEAVDQAAFVDAPEWLEVYERDGRAFVRPAMAAATTPPPSPV